MSEQPSGTRSLWEGTATAPSYPPLRADTEADVCVVGSGIAGLSTAYELTRAGLGVVVLEKEAEVAAGESRHTSAHLANGMDDRFQRLNQVFGEDGTRQAVESHGAAIDRIEEIVASEGIDCEFQRVDGFLVPGPEDAPDWIEREFEAVRAGGFEDAETLADTPVEGMGGPCIRFPRQAQFHPLRYMTGVAAALTRLGGVIHNDTAAADIEADGDGGSGGNADRLRVTTRTGHSVSARHVVLATNSPAGRYLATMKMVPYRTFVVGLSIPPGSVPHALYWDNAEPYHYVRVAEDGGDEVLLVGGGDYRTGSPDRAEEVFHELTDWARARFPDADAVRWRWSGQVLEPADHLAFIGRSHTRDNVYVCTGDSGQGLTHGVIASMRITDMVTGRGERWPIYDPARISSGAVGEYVRDGIAFGRRFLEHLKPGEVRSVDEIAAGSGAIVRRGLREVAAYRDGDGVVHERSAVCPHAGCVVHWNGTENSWDCPCHGSRFRATGELLNGPSTRDLDVPGAEVNRQS